jgi:hypothetical protein
LIAYLLGVTTSLKCDHCFELTGGLLLAIDAGIRTIDLSGNLFVRSIVREGPISFWSVSNFCFANCEFTSESLLSLFKAFATGSGVPFRVDISGLKIAEGSLSGLFEGLSDGGFSESDQRRFVEFVCRTSGTLVDRFDQTGLLCAS